MEDTAILKTLNHLVQLDTDAVHAYNQALESVKDTVIRERLSIFRDEHQEHVNRLRDLILARGGDAPNLSMDFKGYVIEGFITMGRTAGMRGALKALQIAEEIAHRTYGDLVSGNFPDDVKEIIRSHFSDEKIHLAYIVNNY